MLIALLCVLFAPTTQPASQPATQPPTPTDDAVAVLQADVQKAYADIESLHLAGTLDYAVAYADLHYERHRRFSADLDGPQFLHESDTGPTIAHTGETIYVYDPDAQSCRRFAAASGVEQDTLPPYLADLAVEDPGLLLAINGGDLAPLTDNASDVAVDDDGDTIRMSFTRDAARVTLVFDGESHLLRGREIDLKPALEADGLTSVTEGQLSLAYSEVQPGADVAAERLAWKPPAEAEPADAQAAAGGEPEALVGQEAPKFALQNLAGDAVELEKLRGKVVVIDFWATWCPPCRAGLPHVAAMQQRYGDDIKVLAVNQREDIATIKQFLDAQGISVEVLLDTDGAVGNQYGVTGIPTTVILDRDGNVRHVSVGFGPGSENELNDAVEETLRQAAPAE